jgi:hypothetical protein
VAGDEGDGGVDPEDGEDAGEAMVEEDAGVAWTGKFSHCDGGDHDAADDEEEVDAESAMIEEAEVAGGAVSGFDAVEMGEDDEEGGESATDLNADDSAGRRFRQGLQGTASVAPLYQWVGRAVGLAGWFGIYLVEMWQV